MINLRLKSIAAQVSLALWACSALATEGFQALSEGQAKAYSDIILEKVMSTPTSSTESYLGTILGLLKENSSGDPLVTAFASNADSSRLTLNLAFYKGFKDSPGISLDIVFSMYGEEPTVLSVTTSDLPPVGGGWSTLPPLGLCSNPFNDDQLRISLAFLRSV